MKTLQVLNQRTQSQKRKRLPAKAACQECRRRKIRCEHRFTVLQTRSSNTPLRPRPATANKILLNSGTHHIIDLESDSSSYSLSSCDEEEHAASPRARVEIDRKLNITLPQVLAQESTTSRRSVGIVAPEAHCLGAAFLQVQQDRPDRDSTGFRPDSNRNNRRSPETSEARCRGCTCGKADIGCQTNIGNEDVEVFPPSSARAILIDIYFSKIQPILPIVEETAFKKAYAEQSAPTILVQAICLAAAKDYGARRYLCLIDHSTVLAPRPFAERLYASILLGLNSKINHDKVVLIQALALTSLHSEGIDGAENSAMHLAQAIVYAQTIGLHRKYIQGNPEQTALKTLYWCLWTLDRWNAVMYRRPVWINDNDHSPDMKSNATGGKAFLVWLSIAVMLDEVIHLYRPSPGSQTGWDEKFPSFEGIVEKHDGSSIESSLRESLELSYHAVAVLACKPNSPKDNRFSTPSHDRQRLSALSIASMAKSSKTLAPLPLLPYAAALSLAVAYKKLSHSTQASKRESAREELEKCRQILEELSETWWSACSWYRFGERILGDGNGGLLDLDMQRTLMAIAALVGQFLSDLGGNHEPVQVLYGYLPTLSVFGTSSGKVIN